MATRAHSTRTPLLRLSSEGDRLSLQPIRRSPQPLLVQGLGRQSGPVIIASGGPVSRAVQAGRGEALQARHRDLHAFAVAVLSVKGVQA